MVLLPNCPEVLQAYAAILKIGGVIVPVVFLLSPAQVRHILADSEAKVVVTAAQFVDKVEGWTGSRSSSPSRPSSGAASSRATGSPRPRRW
jgi:acyl-CoA synthetase (AMP-forming)/AMP-acid ligase II